MSDLRDAVLALAEAIKLLEVTKQDGGGSRAKDIGELANRARDIANTVEGVDGESDA